MLDIEKIKKDFPIFKRKINGHELVYLDSGATSQKPNEVIEAISDYYKNNNANIHRGVYQLSVESTQMVDEARAAVAAFIGGMFEEIIFTRNTSESINLVMYAWGKENIKSGDSVIVTKLEHHSNLIPWQELCREKGAELRVVDIDNEGRLKLTGETTESFEENGLRVKIGSLEKMLDNSVKMVAVTGVSNVLGTITPLEEIVRMVKKSSSKALILVDAAQMVPHMQVDVKKIGADF
ncbi:MAG TPA: aminotransferase class V-fold PLP-dependent enzyme, partial [Patescibacteria group bacterium]